MVTDQIKKLKLEPDEILVSFDVVSLYTNGESMRYMMQLEDSIQESLGFGQ